MSAQSVQVPVSLIERMKRHMEREQLELLDETVEKVVALLSQPTVEHDDDCLVGEWNEAAGVTCVRTCGATAEPPRIEDMAPGTVFTEEVRWTVTGTLSTGATVAHSGSGEMRFADRFDPSTIRDVTPPA